MKRNFTGFYEYFQRMERNQASMLQRGSELEECEQLGFYGFCRDVQEQQMDRQGHRKGYSSFQRWFGGAIFSFQGGL